MQSWKLIESKKLELIEATDNDFLQDQNYAKIKISLADITSSDMGVFTGSYKYTQYPIGPGRSAVGYISESANSYYKKGQRIFLTPYQKNKADKTLIAGTDFDGYLANFATVPTTRIIELPDSVKEDEAIFIDDIALAYSTLSLLNVKQGEYVLLIGSSFKNIIAAQLIIYRQAIPIILDNDDNRLKIAESLGIYYTINKNLKNEKQRIKEITSGNFVKYLIFDTDSFSDSRDILSYLGQDGKLCFMGFNKMPNALNINIAPLIKNEISIISSNTGKDHITAAINALANSIVDVHNLIENRGELNSADKFINELSTQCTYFKNIIKC